MMKITHLFSQRLSEVAKERGKNQSALARYLNVTRQSCSPYFSGERLPNMVNLCKICEFYNVSSDYLLGFSDSKVVNSPDLKKISDFTKLNYSAILKICKLPKEKAQILSFLITNGDIDKYINDVLFNEQGA